MDDHRFPSPMPEPTDETYDVAPVPDGPVVSQPGEIQLADCYEVGEEVDHAPFPVSAATWREVVAGGSDKADDDYVVESRPIERPTRAGRVVRDFARRKADEQRRADAAIGLLSDPRRFTLRRLLFILTLASIAFAVGTRMPRGVFAGAAGAMALLTAVISRWLVGESAPAKLAWWTLMAVYGIAAVFAVLQL